MANTSDPEFRVLSALMVKNHLYDDYRLCSEMFVHDEYRMVFQAFKRLFTQGYEVTQETLINELQNQGGPWPAAAELECVTTANIQYYVDQLQARYQLKKLQDYHRRLGDALVQRRPVQELLAQAETGLTDLSLETASRSHPMQELVPEYLDFLEKQWKGQIELPIVSTGYENLDHDILGYELGELIIIAARSSIGKTAFALNGMMRQSINHHIPTALISLEMNITPLMQRIVSAQSEVEFTKIRRADLHPGEMDRIQRARSKYEQAPMEIVEAKQTDWSTIRGQIRQLARKQVAVVYIDYLTLIRYGDPRMPRPERVGSLVKEMKQLALELRVVLVVLSQINREGEGKKPTLAQLRQSGEIEEDADQVHLLWRKYRGDRSLEDTVAKCRNGAYACVEFYYDLGYQLITPDRKLGEEEQSA